MNTYFYKYDKNDLLLLFIIIIIIYDCEWLLCECIMSRILLIEIV